MLTANHLQKRFKTKSGRFLARETVWIQAVRDVSLKLDRGQIIGLIGVNGAGKTTTIKMLTTLLEPTSGTYEMDGLDAIKNSMEVKKKINMIDGGERMIYWRLTAWENLWYYGQLYEVPNTLLRKRILELLKLVGLEGKEDIPVETFSKGMKQRLKIARGLINDPQYLFLDEPTIGLDPIIARELRDHISCLARKKEKGILLTSHYMGEIQELCDYIYIISDGVLICEGNPKEIPNLEQAIINIGEKTDI